MEHTTFVSSAMISKEGLFVLDGTRVASAPTVIAAHNWAFASFCEGELKQNYPESKTMGYDPLTVKIPTQATDSRD